MRILLTILLVVLGFIVNGQGTKPSGFPARKTTTWEIVGYGQDDSATIVARRDTLGWLPRFSGTVVMRPQDRNLYWYDSVLLQWNKIAKSGDIVNITASNGLTKVVNDIRQGGTLIQDTRITGAGLYTFTKDSLLGLYTTIYTPDDFLGANYFVRNALTSDQDNPGFFFSTEEKRKIVDTSEIYSTFWIAPGALQFIANNKFNDSTNVFLVSSGQASIQSNFGIKLTNPQNSLDVAGTTRVSDTLKLTGTLTKIDTTANKPLAIDGSGNVVKLNRWPVSGGSIISSDSTIWYNVDSFGARGDGITDNTVAINAAIQAAAIKRGVVYFPAGVYLVRASYRDTAVAYTPKGIVLANGVTLLGAGVGKTTIILGPPPAGATFAPISAPLTYATNTKFFNIITGTNVSNVILRGFSVNGKLSTQINYDPNPYRTPQDSTHTADVETDGIKFIGGINNVIQEVRIDSVPGYGISNFGSTNNIYENLVITNSVNGAVYYSRRAYGSILTKSLITDNNSDNIRIRSSNITVSENEISFTKFNPNVGQANFAGIYLECFDSSNIAPPDIVGVKILGNYLHDNSSFAIDCNNLDTLRHTYSGTSVLIQGNTISYNANGGIQMHMPYMQILNNHLFNNGRTHAGITDPSLPTFTAFVPHPFAFGAVISGNVLRDTADIQRWGLGGSSADLPQVFTFTNNSMYGGRAIIRNPSLTANPIFGNTYFVPAFNKPQSDIATNVSGTIVFNPQSHSISIGDSANTSYVIMTHQNNGESFVLGQSAGVNHMAVAFDNKGLFKVASGGTLAGREIRFWDQATVTNLGGINSDGDFVWGSNATNYAMRAHKYNSDLSVNQHQIEFNGIGSGSAAGQLQGVIHATLNAGYTGSGYPYAGLFDNTTISTGNNLGSLSTGRASYGVLSRSTGAAASGANVALYGLSTSALRNVGVLGDAAVTQNNNASALSAGVIGYGLRQNASATHIGGYFGLQATQPTFTSAALVADNGAEIDPIFRGRDNGVDVLRVNDGGSIYTTGMPLGVNTMKVVLHGPDSLLYQIDASSLVGTPSLTSTYIGVGNGSNQLSGSTAFINDGTSVKQENALASYSGTSTTTLGSTGFDFRAMAKASPTAANQRLGGFMAGTLDGGTTENITAGIQFFSNAAFTPGSSEQTYITFSTSATSSLNEVMRITANARVSIGNISNPTALLHLNSGSTALHPFMLTSASDVTTPLAGGFEFGTLSSVARLTFTPTAGNRRRFPLMNDVAPTNGQLIVGNGTDFTVATAGIGTTGSDFNIAVGAGTITFNIPDASLTARGLVSITSQSFNGQKTFDDGVVATGSGAFGIGTSRLRVTGDNTNGQLNAQSGPNFANDAMTYTDNATAASTTVTGSRQFNIFGANTLAAINSSVTYEDMANVSIRDISAGTNITILRPRSLNASGIAHVDMMANLVTETNSSGTLGKGGHVIFNGTTATFTLPDLATYKGAIYFIKNAGSGDLTVQRSGSDNIYDTASVTSIIIAAGTARMFIAGSSWFVE